MEKCGRQQHVAVAGGSTKKDVAASSNLWQLVVASSKCVRQQHVDIGSMQQPKSKEWEAMNLGQPVGALAAGMAHTEGHRW